MELKEQLKELYVKRNGIEKGLKNANKREIEREIVNEWYYELLEVNGQISKLEKSIKAAN